MEMRVGDLILAQGSYIFVQDGASGQVEVLVGPLKQSLADTDKPVIYDHNQRKYTPIAAEEARRICPVAHEGQYLVLSNPEKENNSHPGKGKQSVPASGLNVGNKINIPGPCTFPLWPGQSCETIDGHQLKSNEYLIIRVYNDKAAKENLSSAIVKTADNKEEKHTSKNLFKDEEIITGKLFIIKGTDVSFYIPPTGIEVLKEDGKYVRNAITLESLEYCILLDQNGNKRYVEGPSVVFPKPTESFISQGGTTKFKALELNDNMGIYIKVIANYEEDGNKYIAGDELFITGKEKKIYFPRAEHAIVKYGKDMIQYSTAIPNGEGRYVLNKDTGEVSLKKGPSMFLPDPRKQVIVKRILDPKAVQLLYPNNNEALNYNISLQEKANQYGSPVDYLEIAESNFSDKRMKSSAMLSAVADELTRSNTYTKPRTITLDTKYEGAVTINVWPGYAVQVVKKTGERRVEVGPKTILLEYDETLEALELSTGKPKSDNNLLKTTYLLTENNIVSDIVSIVTKDLVDVEIRLSYRVNFSQEDIKKWFSVSNYVKLLTQHMRSVIRNHSKKLNIEEFNNSATDILRNIILGEQIEGKRTGKKFSENGMLIYDVEILNITILDKKIAELLSNTQHSIVQLSLELLRKEQELNFTKKSENIEREKATDAANTRLHKIDLELKAVERSAISDARRLEIEKEKQENLNIINDSELARLKSKKDLEINVEEKTSEIRINEVKEKAGSVQPGLIDAIIAMGNLTNNKILAENLKAQGGGLAGIFQQGGIEGLLKAVEGTPLEDGIKELFSKKKDK